MKLKLLLVSAVLHISLSCILALNSIKGIEHCYSVIYDSGEATIQPKDTNAPKWDLGIIPAARINYHRNQTNHKNINISQTAITNIFKALHKQRAFNCFIFFGINFYNSKAVEKFTDDFSGVKCGTLGSNLTAISSCHPRETYFIGLYVDGTHIKNFFNTSELSGKKPQFFALQKHANLTFSYALQTICAKGWIVSTADKTEISKMDLDQWFYDKVIRQCQYVVWWTPTKRGKSFVCKFFEDPIFRAKVDLTATDRVNMNIFKAILYHSNSSFTTTYPINNDSKSTQEVTVNTARSMALYTTGDKSTDLWFVVENFEFGLMSCSHTYLRNDRYLSVFGLSVWITFIFTLIGIGCFLGVYFKLARNETKILQFQFITDFVIRIFLDQFQENPVPKYGRASYKTLLIVIAFGMIILPNSYRGKLAMHFTTPPIRSHVQTIDEGLDHEFTILTDIDDALEIDIKNYLAKPYDLNITTDGHPWSFVSLQHWYTSRFYRSIYDYSNAAATNETKEKYKGVMSKFLNETTNPGWKVMTADILINCTNTMMVAQTTALENIFVNLQTKSRLADLYISPDSKYEVPRVWIIRDDIEWDRANILRTTFRSILHSGVFMYWVRRGFWADKRSVAAIIEELKQIDFDNDSKFDIVFAALLVFEFACILFFIAELLSLIRCRCPRKTKCIRINIV